MERKTISHSKVTTIQQMMQTDANLAGNVHGGVIMKLIDNTAGIVATRHTGKNPVTASLDRLDFHHPVYVSNLLKVMASINMVGTKSMEIGVRVEAENQVTGESRHTATAYLTFVALDDDGTPTVIPPVILETEEEERRNCAAKERKKFRMEQIHKKTEDCRE